MTAYLIVCPLVFLAGLVDSIAGGGGLISLPGYLIAGVPAHLALGTNKMSSTIGTSISAVRLLKHGYLKGKMKMAIASAVCAMTGSVLGARMSLLVSESVIRHMMIVVLPIVAYHVLKNKHMGEDEKTGTAEKRMQGTQSDQHQPESIERCDACGSGDDLQLCGKPDSHQPGSTGN